MLSAWPLDVNAWPWTPWVCDDDALTVEPERGESVSH